MLIAEASHRCVRLSGVGPMAALLTVWLTSSLAASDHADPMDPLRWKAREPVISDLFVFPVDQYGAVFEPFTPPGNIPLHPVPHCFDPMNPDPDKCRLPVRPPLGPAKADDLKKMSALIVLFCVRPALEDVKSLNLDPYTYRIHMDTQTGVTVADDGTLTPTMPEAGSAGYAGGSEHRTISVEEAVARYGGLIQRPGEIKEDMTIEIHLNNDGSLNHEKFKLWPRCPEEAVFGGAWTPQSLCVWSGVRDDPFIFPSFFKTNVVGMAISIPLHCLPPGKTEFLIWGTSHRGGRQIDHVGRSLRTQNPRFELLNTRHPREHVKAIEEERADPSLMRDVLLRANLQSLFAFRDWDPVPDVMIYSMKYPVGFPNGRLLTDDVAALLAQHGDTLLLELSHQTGTWPRKTNNDRSFLEKFPYLAPPWESPQPAQPYKLSWKNTLILWAIGLVVVATAVLAILQVIQLVRWGVRRRCRKREIL